MKPIWRKGKFLIATDAGKIEVEGETCGRFGIAGNPNQFKLTHLASGYAFPLFIKLLNTKKNLRLFASRLEALDDLWDFKEVEDIDKGRAKTEVIKILKKMGELNP